MGVDDAQTGHIHQAAAGTNGGILVDLTLSAGDMGLWTAADDAALDPSGLDALNSGLLYYNIHTQSCR